MSTAMSSDANVAASPSELDDSRALYLDLMKRCLLNMIYGDKEVVYAAPRHPVKKLVVQAVRALGVEAVHVKEFDAAKRLEGRD